MRRKGLSVALLAVSLGWVGLSGQVRRPPLNLPPYQLPRPNEVVRATYNFAAEHPEVLRYLPCFCGCEMLGHTSNASCFIKTRAANGDVTAWDDHGIVCPMCLAVGEEAMRQHAAGKSVQEIRTAVEAKFGGLTGTRTPTPEPPQR